MQNFGITSSDLVALPLHSHPNLECSLSELAVGDRLCVAGRLFAVLSLVPPLLRAAAVFIPSPPGDHKRLPPVFSLRIYFLARTSSIPTETRGSLRAQATSGAPWVLRSPRLGEQPLGSVQSGCILRAHVMQSVAGSHFCCSAWVCMFLCESRGRDVGELLIFSDTLTVLVPRCPVKADCVCPCVSLSCSGEGWSDCPAYFCCTWKGSALHPFSNLPRQSSHKGHSLHLISALGYFPSLPLGTFPAQLPSLPLPA